MILFIVARRLLDLKDICTLMAENMLIFKTDVSRFLFLNWVWAYIHVIPEPRRLRQENIERKASVGYMIRFCLKKKA